MLNLVHDVGPAVDVLVVPDAGGLGLLDDGVDAGEGVGLHVVGPDGVVLVLGGVLADEENVGLFRNATLSGLAMLWMSHGPRVCLSHTRACPSLSPVSGRGDAADEGRDGLDAVVGVEGRAVNAAAGVLLDADVITVRMVALL